VAGHFEKVNAGGRGISAGSDIVVTSSILWVPDNWVSGMMPIPGPGLPPKPEPKREERQDYCGAEGSAGVPDQIMGGDISGGCAVHDACYATSGDNKEACDAKLGILVALLCALNSANTKECQLIGAAYFVGVTLGGHGPYRSAQRKARRR
jgi:hypothetical protein